MLSQFDRTEVRGDDHAGGGFQRPHGAGKEPDRRDHVDRYVEHGLQRRRMGIDDEEPVGAGGDDDVGRHAGADRLARPRSPVLAGVAEVGDDGGDAVRSTPAARVEQKRQLDEVVVDRRPGRLDDVHVVAANVVDQRAEFPVGEPLDLAAHPFGPELLGHGAGQERAGAAGHDPEGHQRSRGTT